MLQSSVNYIICLHKSYAYTTIMHQALLQNEHEVKSHFQNESPNQFALNSKMMERAAMIRKYRM